MLRVLLTAVLFALGASAASAHAMLDHASPAAGSTVQRAPARITLRFTEPLEPAFSEAVVRNTAGQRVDTGARVGGDKMELQVSVKPLPPGVYKVNWRVMSVDTHKTQGSFSFTVGKP